MRCIACGTDTPLLESISGVAAAFCRQHLPEKAEISSGLNGVTTWQGKESMRSE